MASASLITNIPGSWDYFVSKHSLPPHLPLPISCCTGAHTPAF